MSIEILGFAGSTYVQTVVAACREVGVAFELKPLAFKEPSHFALHPFGKMPVMRDGDFVLHESLAIADYVSQASGGALWPSAPRARARALQWASSAIDYYYPALVAGLLSESPSDAATSEAAEKLKLIDVAIDAQRGEGPWLAGEALSVADLLLYPMVRFATGKLGAEGAAGLAALSGWARRMEDRPSMAQ